MKSMVALDSVIKDLEVRIAIAKGQLARHNSGEEKLSLLAESSAEISLEKHLPRLEKYKALFKELEKHEKNDSYEHRRLRAAVERKKYYKFNKIYNRKVPKKKKTRENDERIEASMIIDELPEETILDKKELYQLSLKSLEKHLAFDAKSEVELGKIQEDFNRQIRGFSDENIKSLELLNYMIPIVIFHFHIFIKTIIEYKNSELGAPVKENEFEFFPKYQDWWIDEIWESHIAYFSLYKWKKSIKNLCYEESHQEAWEIIFTNWIFVKTLMNEKSQLAFEYQYIFDTMIQKYVKLESELDKEIVINSQKEIENFIKEENLLDLSSDHVLFTNYLDFKQNVYENSKKVQNI